jgi:hypothetical protein
MCERFIRLWDCPWGAMEGFSEQCASNLYGVLFDGEVLLRIMYGDYLEQVEL